MKNKTTIISTIICLLPMVLAAVLYPKLPAQIGVHFSNTGVADNYLPKAVAAFGSPILLALINLYSHARINLDPKNENASISLKNLSKWLVPIISVIMNPVTLFMAIGVRIPIVLIAQIIVGIVIVITGNYLPKCKRNYTIGIKLPWTLDNEDNWNRTHRLAGFVWVIGGFVMLLNAFLNISLYIMFVVIILLVVLPFMYSYLSYQKEHKKAD